MLKDIKCFLLDMDGTFYLGNKLFDGSLKLLDILKKNNSSYLFLTNNSSKNRTAYKEKLHNLGCDVSEDKIFTSGEATAIYIKNIKQNASIFLLGTPYLEKEFRDFGFKIVKDRGIIPDYVVLGFDTTLTYEKLWIACDLIRKGVPYIATHSDLNCPIENGEFMPDAGSIIKMIQASTEKLPLVIGKPNKYIVDAILNKYNLKKEEVAIVGDRLYTDIKTGENAGITSILVLSGETTIEMYENSSTKADYIFPSISELGMSLLVPTNPLS